MFLKNIFLSEYFIKCNIDNTLTYASLNISIFFNLKNSVKYIYTIKLNILRQLDYIF